MKWSLSHVDGTTPSDFTAMTEENKKWLQAAMKDLVKDENRDMADILVQWGALLEDESAAARVSPITSEEIDRLDDSILTVTDLTENIDNALNFMKLKGWSYITQLLQLPDAAVPISSKLLLLSLLATLAQNNPAVQVQMEVAGVHVLLEDICGGTESPNLFNKALYALSCIVRGMASLEDLVCRPQGLAAIGRPLGQESGVAGDLACLRRTLFLASALAASDSASPARLASLADCLLPRLLAASTAAVVADVSCRECALRFILSVVSMTPHGRTWGEDARLQSFLAEVDRAAAEDSDEEQRRTDSVLIRDIRAAAALLSR